jgi:DNA repair protein RadD
MYKIRLYQGEAERDIYSAWSNGARNTLLVLPTGSGKTVIFSDILRQHKGASCAIAHRQELVSQISLALAREEVKHRIIGPKEVVKLCVSLHMSEIGKAYYDPAAVCAVAGIDTLIRRGDVLKSWADSVTLWAQDEAHHLLTSNKWGRGIELFPNARGLGVTATPLRADGKGLGRHADGVFDTMIVGPTARELINMGYLTDYRIFCPQSNLNLSDVPVSQVTGDYNPIKLKTAVRRSKIIGDVVEHYLKIAPGKLGVTFATDVQTATDISNQFNAAGVPSLIVHADTPDHERIAAIKKFRTRQILQLVNVDLFGEGFDLPAIEVVSMARPTKSYSLYVQQFGRGLRPIIADNIFSRWNDYTDAQRRAYIATSIKPAAIIIDHVNNVDPMHGGHGLPDGKRTWTLSRRDKRAANEETPEPVRSCPNCTGVYKRYLPACPYCGFKPIPTQRNAPEFVDGDLCELDAATLAAMRDNVAAVDMPKEDYRLSLVSKGVPLVGQLANVKRHTARQEAQKILRESIAWWGGFQRALGRLDSESYKRFYFLFDTDVLTAQILKPNEALKLEEKINLKLREMVNNGGIT